MITSFRKIVSFFHVFLINIIKSHFSFVIFSQGSVVLIFVIKRVQVAEQAA